ncbi:MAG: ATP-binding protein, partial [Pseudomonadota bacterium]
MDTQADIAAQLRRIAEYLIASRPLAPQSPDWDAADGFVWRAEQSSLVPVTKIPHLPLELLLGIDQQKRCLLENSQNFVQGFAANNALLWGARGTGKSSLIKAVHARVNKDLAPGQRVKLVEILREDLESLGYLLDLLRTAPKRFLLFCDDLSFEAQDSTYKALKALLEGGIAGKPDNCVFYATSNRRHLISREATENEAGLAIHANEVVHEKTSLSDRFGLWVGFHNCDQETYLA